MKVTVDSTEKQDQKNLPSVTENPLGKIKLSELGQLIVYFLLSDMSRNKYLYTTRQDTGAIHI